MARPFRDASQDLLQLNLTKLGNTKYQMTATRLVSGFANPIDAEIIGHRIYVLELGGSQGLWELLSPRRRRSLARPRSRLADIFSSLSVNQLA